MAIVDGSLQLGYKDSAWFTANASVVLLVGQIVYLEQTGTYKIGDGVTALSALSFLGGSGVQSVTGPQVDDTDPNNPIVNPLGLIQIDDKNGDFFTDLASATAYIEQYFNPSIITDKSFNEGIFFFTVPPFTFVNGSFLTDNITPSVTYASLIDRFGLLDLTNAQEFGYKNAGHHILGNGLFQNSAFNFFTGSVEMNSLFITASGGNFAESSTGKFIIKENIGVNETAQFGSNFFLNSTATIFVNASKYTSNAGGIQGDLVTAITNGCNVQFDGIDLEKVSNKSTSIVTDQASNTKYPSVKSVFDWVTSTFATIASLASYVTITGTETLTNKTIKKRILVVTQSATPSTNINNGDIMQITGLAQAITSMTTNLTGTPYDGQMIMWQVTDNGTARALTLGSAFAASTNVALPTTTVAGVMLTWITMYKSGIAKHEVQYVN